MKARSFTLFYALSSFAEGAQTVVLLWVTYALTHSAFLVGLMVVLGYLPAAVVGLLARRAADRGRADRMAQGTNLVLAVTSTVVTIQQLAAGDAVTPTIVVIAGSQVVLSLAKMINKAALNRLVRDLFDRGRGKRVLEVSSSAALIGQVAGAGVAGVLLARSWIAAGLVLAAGSYAASVWAMHVATRGYREPVPEAPAEPPAERAEPPAEPLTAPAAAPGGVLGAGRGPGSRIRWSGALVSVLVFSVPSSGALQFVNTLQVPLAAEVAPQQPGYYAVLNVVSVLGGFLAGILLSTNVITTRQVLFWAMPATVALALALAVSRDEYLVAAVNFLLTLIITCHVICMQVLTNQTPRHDEIGQFAIVRNVVASLAKAVFSFAAGAVTGAFGMTATTIVLAVTMAAFSIAWFVSRAMIHSATTVSGEVDVLAR